MNCPECIAQLHDYVDGELAAADRHTVETHLARCPACRAGLESLRSLRQAAAALPRAIVPQRDLWPQIRLEVGRVDPAAPPPPAVRAGGLGSSRPTTLRWLAPLAVAASIVLLATLAERPFPAHRSAPAWAVASLSGAPRVNAKPVRGEAKFRVGQWLETDAASRARVTVGAIGEVRLEPNSRLRLVDTAATDHRLELARGTLHALVWAPPRLFFVDTPSATAVDLGCAYTLSVDDEGGGELHVLTGYVALEYDGRESIVPGGAMCLTRRHTGPGTPFAADAPHELRAALQRFDFDGDATDATLRKILAPARVEDAITLWHLLARTDHAQRAAVFDALSLVRPPPEGVTRAGILAGDTAMRHAWAAELGLGSFGF